MSNKSKKVLAFIMVLLSLALYALIICRKVIWGVDIQAWQYMAPTVCFVVFLALFRNYSQAVKEDDKYGPLNK